MGCVWIGPNFIWTYWACVDCCVGFKTGGLTGLLCKYVIILTATRMREREREMHGEDQGKERKML
jgi:hypothetical protein